MKSSRPSVASVVANPLCGLQFLESPDGKHDAVQDAVSHKNPISAIADSESDVIDTETDTDTVVGVKRLRDVSSAAPTLTKKPRSLPRGFSRAQAVSESIQNSETIEIRNPVYARAAMPVQTNPLLFLTKKLQSADVSAALAAETEKSTASAPTSATASMSTDASVVRDFFVDDLGADALEQATRSAYETAKRTNATPIVRAAIELLKQARLKGQDSVDVSDLQLSHSEDMKRLKDLGYSFNLIEPNDYWSYIGRLSLTPKPPPQPPQRPQPPQTL